MSIMTPIAEPATYDTVRQTVSKKLTEILGADFDPENATQHDRLIQQRLWQKWETTRIEQDGPIKAVFDDFMQRQTDVFRIGRHVARTGLPRSKLAPAYALVEDLNAQTMHFFISELRTALEQHPEPEKNPADILPLIKQAVGNTLKAFTAIGDTHRIYPLWIEMEPSERNVEGIEHAVDRIAEKSPRQR